MNAFVENIPWREMAEVVGWDLWWLAKLAAKASVLLAVVAVAVAFALLRVLVTGRLPWFVRRWF